MRPSSDEPMAWAGLLLCLGVATAPLWMPRPGPALLGAVLLAVLAVLASGARTRRVQGVALGLGALLVGAASGSPSPPRALPSELHTTAEVTALSGRMAWVDTPSGPMAWRFRGEAPRPGARIAAWTAGASPPAVLPGEWPWSAPFWRAGRPERVVRSWVRLGGDPVRDPSPPPDRWLGLDQGAILQALATGDRSRIPESTLALMRRTGTRHLLSISGLHVGLVAGLAWALARLLFAPAALLLPPRVGSALPALAALGAAAAYAQVVGWPVSTQRAVVMVAAGAAARGLGRDLRPWTFLGLAAGAIALGAPGLVRTASFALSFGAVVGILLVAPRLMRLLPPDAPRALRWACASGAVTLGAQLGTLPVTAWLFQECSPLAPLCNLVAGPLLGTIAVPAALLGAWTPGPAGDAALWAGDAAVGLALEVLAVLDAPPWTPAVGPVGAAGLLAALALRRRPLLAVLLAASCLAAPCLRPAGPPRLVVTFLAVGQGDAALVEMPDGRRWLVDGGPHRTSVLHWLRRTGVRRLDAVALSHPHPDHMAGLQSVIEALEVGELWAPRPPEPRERAFRALWLAAARRGVRLRTASDPPGAGIQILHPRPGFVPRRRQRVNEESLVLRFEHGARSVLFTGDIERGAEASLAPGLARVDVLKVPHHGSRSSSTPPLVRAAAPELAVVSAARDGPFGHPHPEALAAWAGVALLRTDRDGTIEVSTDGDRLEVRSWRWDRGWRSLRRRPWTPIDPPP